MPRHVFQYVFNREVQGAGGANTVSVRSRCAGAASAGESDSGGVGAEGAKAENAGSRIGSVQCECIAGAVRKVQVKKGTKTVGARRWT